MEGKGLILFPGVESVLFGSVKESREWGDILEVTSSLVMTLMRENVMHLRRQLRSVVFCCL